MITIKSGEIARDLAFLQLAEDDRLAELGFHYGNITPRTSHDPAPVDENTDLLVMSWSDCLDRDGMLRQRVCLAAVGPSVRASKDLLRETLARAGTALLAAAGSRPPIAAITIAKPHLWRSVGGRLVTIGFDVFSTA